MNDNNIYDNYANFSYIDEKNFEGKLNPYITSNSFIKCSDINNFYNDTYIYIHLYSSLYFELYKNNNDNRNDISIFKNLIKELKIKIEYNTENNSIGSLNTTNKTYTFNLYAVKNYNFSSYDIYNNININNTNINLLNTNNYYNYNTLENTRYISPVLNNIILPTSTDDFTLNTLYNISENNVEYNKNNINNEIKNIISSTSDYISINRKKKLLNIIKEILSQQHENILSYLLYYKIYYHIILYNITLQIKFRENYLNNNNDLRDTINDIQKNNIINTFTNMINNLDNINNNILNFNNNDYIKDKYNYTLKIENLNAIKKEYARIENNLNNTIREYNKYIKNFKTIKTFGNFIIIFLIVIIIITILITILSTLSFNFKNYYYLGTFIILSIITYIYYNRFKYINLYERFQAIANETCNKSLTYNSKSYINKKNHALFYNDIVEYMNNYNKKIKDTSNNIKTNIYTIGNKVFSQDADIYLYNLYKEKKQQNESNRIKQSSLSNMLETLRKRVVYLFNVILLISLLTLILLFGLLLYINFPFFLTYIVIVCIILLFIVIAYFMIAIVQPTRMVANKNYWANQNPSKNLLVKL
jgi:hypothetical protein